MYTCILDRSGLKRDNSFTDAENGNGLSSGVAGPKLGPDMGKATIQIGQLVWAVSHHKHAQMVSLFVRDFMAKNGWQREAGSTANNISNFFARPAMLRELDAHCQLMMIEGRKAVAAVFRDQGITSVCPDAWFQAAEAVVEALYVPEDLLA